MLDTGMGVDTVGGITSPIMATGAPIIGLTGSTITEPITAHLKDITIRDANTGGIVCAVIIKGATDMLGATTGITGVITAITGVTGRQLGQGRFAEKSERTGTR